MNGNQISRLAHSLNELRPDWPIASLTTWLSRNLANRPYRDAAVALAWVATDMKPDGTWASETQARVLEAGPWWRAASAGESVASTPGPPKRELECPQHVGQPAPPYCGPCNVDHLGDDATPTPTHARPRPASPDVRAAALATSRDALRRPAEQKEAE